MYISEFWCGVGATVLVELASIVSYLIYLSGKEK